LYYTKGMWTGKPLWMTSLLQKRSSHGGDVLRGKITDKDFASILSLRQKKYTI
jgi:hypothetical protein